MAYANFAIYKCFINKIKDIIKMVQGQGQGQGNAGPTEAGNLKDAFNAFC